MQTNTLTMNSTAPTILLEGVLIEALSQITQNQVMMRMQNILLGQKPPAPNGDRKPS